MKKIAYTLALFIVLCAFINRSYSECTTPYFIGSYYYHYITNLPDGEDPANIETLFYAYNSDTQGNFAHNGSYSQTLWFVNDFGVWYAYGDWSATGTTDCPPLGLSDETVQMIAWDTTPSTADAPVMFAVLGAPIAYGPYFIFDYITDGEPSYFGGPYNCAIPLQDIPQVTVTGSLGSSPPYTVGLTWQEPSHYSYGVNTNHTEYFWGYRVYYTTTYGYTPNPPTSNATDWLPVYNNTDYVPRGTGGASVQINFTPGSEEWVWFALSIVGQGEDSQKSPVATPFETGFVGQSSLNYWEPCIPIVMTSVEGLTWWDVNGNGYWDSGENDYVDVTVNLYYAEAIVASQDAEFGIFIFDNEAPCEGLYFLEFETPFGYSLSPSGGDSDPDPTTGRTQHFFMSTGTHSGLWQAGFVMDPGNVGDYVWQDDDMDGVQDPTEQGLPNVEVRLLDQSMSVVDTCFTDAAGMYSFTDKTAGDYYIEFVLPAQYVFSPPNQGDDNHDSDADPVTGRTDQITISPFDNNMYWDAGMYFTAVPTLTPGVFIIFSFVMSTFLLKMQKKTIRQHRRPNNQGN